MQGTMCSCKAVVVVDDGDIDETRRGDGTLLQARPERPNQYGKQRPQVRRADGTDKCWFADKGLAAFGMNCSFRIFPRKRREPGTKSRRLGFGSYAFESAVTYSIS